METETRMGRQRRRLEGCGCEPKATRSGDGHSWQRTWDPFLFQCPKKVFAQQGGVPALGFGKMMP